MWWAPLAIQGVKMLGKVMQNKNDQALAKAVGEADLVSSAVALHQGANPNICDSEGCPILFHAISTGDVKLVKLLIDKGASIDVEAPDGLRPLMRAVCRQVESIVQLLVESGCSVSQFNEATGGYPINEAAFSGHAGILYFLLSRGADANSRARSGLTPLLWILVSQAMPIIDPSYAESEDYKETTEIVNLERSNAKQIIAKLLDAGSDPNLSDFNGFSALMLAATLDDAELINLLCKHGAKTNATNTSGNTALMAASHLGKISAINALLEMGANPMARDADGETALDIAKSQNQSGAIQLLSHHS